MYGLINIPRQQQQTSCLTCPVVDYASRTLWLGRLQRRQLKRWKLALGWARASLPPKYRRSVEPRGNSSGGCRWGRGSGRRSPWLPVLVLSYPRCRERYPFERKLISWWWRFKGSTRLLTSRASKVSDRMSSRGTAAVGAHHGLGDYTFSGRHSFVPVGTCMWDLV